jgi:Tol biopolymer transport system component
MSVALSPDGKRVATSVLDPASHTFDIWLYDTSRPRPVRFTFEGSRTYLPAIWSPDGASIVFASRRNSKYGLYRKAADLSGGEELLYSNEFSVRPATWSRDGAAILCVFGDGSSSYGRGLFSVPLTGERKPVAVAQLPTSTDAPQISFDGRSLAYSSIESSRAEIYVVTYPEGAGKVQVSVNGGMQARWRRDGKEIYYIAPDGRLMAVEIKTSGTTIQAGRVEPLFAV